MRLIEEIEVKTNLVITARERGKIVARREGHNIFLNTGREWLAQLIAYLSFSPDVPENDYRVRYMGLGIGGSRQLVPNTSMLPQVNTDYAGSNAQTDTNPNVIYLERPVRLSGSATPFPFNPSDVWLGQIQAPADHPIPNRTTFTRVFTDVEVNYTPYETVPLSEIGLYTAGANPNIHNNTGLTFVAYDTFDTLSKTSAIQLQVDWTLIF